MDSTYVQVFQILEPKDWFQYLVFMGAIVALFWIYFVKRRGSKNDSEQRKETGDLRHIRKMLERDATELKNIKEELEKVWTTIHTYSDRMISMNKEISEIVGMLKVILKDKG